jgi:hypothetical protein
VHGHHTYDYTKDFEAEEWPRAALAIDLASISPIIATGPTLLASEDVYQTIVPKPPRKSMNPTMPVAKAIATDEKSTTKESLPSVVNAREGEQKASNNNTIPVEKALPITREIRRAQPALPMDLPSASPVMNLTRPKPIEFY